MKTTRIEILNWEKYQSATDQVRHPYWFKVHNTIIGSQKLYDLPLQARWFWICLLAIASQERKNIIDLSLGWFIKSQGFYTKKKVLKYLAMLEELRMINIIDFDGKNDCTIDCTQLCTQHSTLEEIRSEKNREEEKHNPPDGGTLSAPAELLGADPSGKKAGTAIRGFDFEALYQLYPKKAGKVDGLAECAKQIRTQNDYQALELAIRNYRAYILRKPISGEFIPPPKHFSTFMRRGRWRECLEPGYGSTELSGRSQVKLGVTREHVSD